MTVQRAENHPQPQLVRERWTDLGGPWRFAHDDADRGLDEGWPEREDVFDRTIVVPFPPESRASGVADPAFHPIAWYRRAFRVAPEDRGRRLLLHFGAVDYRAGVWVNGRLVAAHEGGHTPFSADISPALRDGAAEQVIVVRAEDRPEDRAQPRGKQDWEPRPHRIWYHRTTGIWQPVWLEAVAPAHLAALRWTPAATRGALTLDATCTAETPRGARLRARLSLNGAMLAEAEIPVEGGTARHEFALPAPHERFLWSPETPTLLDADLTLLDGARALDRVASYAGLRDVACGGGRFLLNGRPYYLRLVLEQGYWPESHLAAPGAAALRREVELIKELGFNGARIHQKVEDPRFLYWCDRLGLLIWGEMANAYVFSPAVVERLTREWLEAVRRDYSHPCVVAWVPLNESWGVPDLPADPAQRHFVRALYHLTRALDPTRPALDNEGWEHVAGDILGVHDYAGDGATLLARYGTPEALARTLRESWPGHRAIVLDDYRRGDEPVMLTEYGGISYAPAPGEEWYGYSTVGSAADYLAKYAELTGAVHACVPLAGYCYTQLTDTEQETNGLLTADRRPKLDPAAIRAVNVERGA
ncbi:MAG TPA: glycoside hydrolase family 2 TIM barrel-domain containing protein [Thermomicrobiales bacterium]|nr:glycoside hydrolase family 2 TIM barrel-domain containing protein [Thermomicrobiales bacterium]